ncbi:MAG: Cysteine desulfurase [uncultured Chthoniobacterales bacterium]|uniref:Cysteine desulfurase n=1 Tax=uncultured Chthoniobacterales bacterium TaxID=1836801 RepID=A0A6J4IWZ9_9BACT|nr:MAG: Cysteine desulfurase [uncultured Chthoniobacterales bacterium]
MTIYLDYNATTPLCAPARDAMLPYLEQHYGNPSSIHAAGREARAAIDDARDRLSAIIGAKPHELIFTATGTEANNLAILGLARAHAARGRHLICAGTEHHAVLHAFQHLQRDEAFDVTFLGVDEAGLIDPQQLAAMIRPDTTLVSIMTANNETGVVQPLREIAGICRTRGVLLHSDMVQSFGKLPIDFSEGVADAASFAAHKFYGPKGAGFLYLRAGLPIQPILFGGAHENDRRPGTENVPAIAGMAAAAEWVHADLDAEQPREAALRDQLWRAIAIACPTARQNGEVDQRLANTLNVSFPGVSSETMLMALDLEGVCASSGSACMVGSVMASHVLLAMGHAAESAASAVRFSLGRQTTPEEIAAAADAIQRILARLSPTPEHSDRRPYAAV